MSNNKYSIDDKIIYAKLTQAGVKDGISINKLSKKLGVSDVTLKRYLTQYEAGDLKPELEKQEASNDICGKIDLTNEFLRQCLLRFDVFYKLTETKADEFIEAVRVLGDKLDDPHEPDGNEGFEHGVLKVISDQSGG